MGRPPLPEEKTRSIVFTIRLSPEERAAIEAVAHRDGRHVTQWAREALLAAVRARPIDRPRPAKQLL
jgi:predicted HicB family RNase H-like nuclease